MSFSGLLIAAIAAQAAPQAMRPSFPWDGQVQSLVCSTVSSEPVAAEYVLTLTDSDGFIVGQEAGQTLQMEAFAPFEKLPPVSRGQAIVRRLSFAVGSQSAFVRQLYQSGAHVSTFISVGTDATAERDLPFETIAGFCQPTQPKNAEASQ